MNDNTRLLVCYPSFLSYDLFWRDFWKNNWFKLKPYVKINRLGDAMITRPQAFNLYGDRVVKLWKEIFSNKNLCFITGKSSRLNINHLLFSTAKNKTFIYSKNNDAYDDLENILIQCQNAINVDLFIIALGPTGTVLSAKLSCLGFQALDIGHVTNSYDTVYKGASRPEAIPFKRE